MITITIWDKEDRDPWTVAFDDPAKAKQFKEKAELMIAAAGSTLRVTEDSGEVNNDKDYLDCLAEELDVEIPEAEDTVTEEMAQFRVRYAMDSRYTAVVLIPKKNIPSDDCTDAEMQAFIDKINEEAESVYWGADFGEAEDVTGKQVYIEDENGDFLWEDGRIIRKKH